MGKSILEVLGGAIAVIFKPLGFGNWQSAVAIISGLGAQEVVVATFGTLGGETLIKSIFTPLSAFAFMAFTLLYTPCFAAIMAIKNETNSWKWPAFMCAITITTAYIVACLIYNVGLLAGFG